MSLNLYFLRHGETTYSISGSYCGIVDAPLTPEGVQMAQAFAQAYQSVPWTAVYCSPMQRTVNTAKPLCDAIGIEMQLRDGLKELGYGEWEDKTPEWVKEHYLEDYIKWMTEPAWNPPTGGETAVQMASRASLVISEIESRYTDGNILVVSHKTTIRIILCSLLGIDLGRYRDRLDLQVGGITKVKFGTYGPMLQSLGDRSYLDPSLQARRGT